MKKIKHFSILFIIFINRYLVDSKLLEKNTFLDELYLNNIDNNKFLGKYNKIDKISNNNSNNNFISLESKNFNNWFHLKNISFFTYFHLSLSFLIVPLLSILLIFIDTCGDKSIKANLSLPSNMKVKIEYNLFKNTYIIRAKYLFSWLLFKYLILFVIELLSNTLITSLLVLAVQKQIIENIFKFRAIMISIVFSLIVSVIMHFILDFTYKFLFEFHYIRREIFKSKFEILRKYIYYIVKKDILFNSKWNSIRNRMFTYYRVCGPLLLKQVKRNKYQKYVFII